MSIGARLCAPRLRTDTVPRQGSASPVLPHDIEEQRFPRYATERLGYQPSWTATRTKKIEHPDPVA